MGWPDAVSHTRAALSSLPVTTHRPSGLNDAVPTRLACRNCGVTDRPVAAWNTWAALSAAATTSRVPSGLKPPS